MPVQFSGLNWSPESFDTMGGLPNGIDKGVQNYLLARGQKMKADEATAALAAKAPLEAAQTRDFLAQSARREHENALSTIPLTMAGRPDPTEQSMGPSRTGAPQSFLPGTGRLTNYEAEDYMKENAAAKEKRAELAAFAKASAGNKPSKLDPITYRQIAGAPVLGSLQDDYISGYNQYRKNPNPTSVQSFATAKLAQSMPAVTSYLSQNPGAIDVRQLKAADQLAYLKAMEISQQMSGSSRPPSKELVEELYNKMPRYTDQPSNFAYGVNEMGKQVTNRAFEGNALASRLDPSKGEAVAQLFESAGKKFRLGRKRVEGIKYDENDNPILPEFGTGGGASPEDPHVAEARRRGLIK